MAAVPPDSSSPKSSDSGTTLGQAGVTTRGAGDQTWFSRQQGKPFPLYDFSSPMLGIFPSPPPRILGIFTAPVSFSSAPPTLLPALLQ